MHANVKARAPPLYEPREDLWTLARRRVPAAILRNISARETERIFIPRSIRSVVAHPTDAARFTADVNTAEEIRVWARSASPVFPATGRNEIADRSLRDSVVERYSKAFTLST